MIADVAVTPDAIAQLCPAPGRTRQELRRSGSALRTLHQYATVVFESAASRAEALQRLKEAGGGVNTLLLLDMLKADAVTSRVASEPLPGLADVVDVERLSAWRGHADVVALSDGQYELLEDEAELPEDPEPTTVWDLGSTDVLDRVQVLRGAALARGTSREDAWSQRFAPLCRTTKVLNLVDVHLGEQVCEGYLAGHRPACAGARWFLGKVARTGVHKVVVATRLPRVRVAGGASGALRSAAEVRRAFALLGEDVGLAPEHLTVVVVRSTREDKFPHPRHLRFDKRLVVSLHNGLQTFEEAVFSESATCTASVHDVDDMAKQMRRLRGREEP